jgi:hypothetical protein
LTQQAGQAMASVLAGARIDESVGTHVGQTQRVVQLAIGEQPCIGRDRRAVKLKHQSAVEIEPQSTPIRFTRRVPHFCPVCSLIRC